MGKKELREFELQYLHLPNGEHDFGYEIKSSFFDLFPETLVDHGVGQAQLHLLKTETLLTLTFDIRVTLTLVCDVSLREYEQEVTTKKRLLVKFGEEESEPDDEVIVVKHDRIGLNVADFLHQYISLEVPMKKVHPDLAEDERPDLAFTTTTSEEAEDQDYIDPRWEALKKLKE